MTANEDLNTARSEVLKHLLMSHLSSRINFMAAEQQILLAATTRVLTQLLEVNANDALTMIKELKNTQFLGEKAVIDLVDKIEKTGTIDDSNPPLKG
jgi:hypothetical protein